MWHVMAKAHQKESEEGNENSLYEKGEISPAKFFYKNPFLFRIPALYGSPIVNLNINFAY